MGRPTQVHTLYCGTIWIVSHQSSQVGASGTLERINQSHGMSLRCLSCVWSLQPLKKRVQHVTACSGFLASRPNVCSPIFCCWAPSHIWPELHFMVWAELCTHLMPFKMPRLLPINDQRQNQRAFVSKEYETTMHQRKMQRRLSFLIFWFLV